jgi:hypothetical protein
MHKHPGLIFVAALALAIMTLNAFSAKISDKQRAAILAACDATQSACVEACNAAYTDATSSSFRSCVGTCDVATINCYDSVGRKTNSIVKNKSKELSKDTLGN